MSYKYEHDISVIVPVFNGEQYMKKCLDSILEQDCDLEIIVVDDGSTDGSWDILKSYERKYGNVLLIRQANLHAGIARNVGLQMARGEYIHFFDVDDVLLPNSYSKLIDFSRRNQLDYVKLRVHSINAVNGNKVDSPAYSLDLLDEKYFEKVICGDEEVDVFLHLGYAPWSGICRRAFLIEHGILFDSLKRVNDHSFYVQVITTSDRKGFYDGYVLNHYVNNPNSLAAGRRQGMDYDCYIEALHIVENVTKYLSKRVRRSVLNTELNSFAYDYLELPNDAKEKYIDMVRTGIVERYENEPGLSLNEGLMMLRDAVNKNYKHEYYIFGAGKYGKALYRFLKDRGINVKAFIQTSHVSDAANDDIPVICIDELSSNNIHEAVIFLAVNEQRIRVLAKTELLIRHLAHEENIIDCARFIETNCLKKRFVRYCTLCGKSVEAFLQTGIDSEATRNHKIIGAGIRENARCPLCGEIDRYRWCYYVISKFTDMLHSKCSILHFAAESSLSNMISTNPDCNYVTADIQKNKCMLAIDAIDNPFKDESFDYVIANHILEHIPDDRKALSEIYRVLKSNGMALVSFPICTDQKTIEDDGTSSEDERLAKFGQKDHVRLYGTDYKERLEAVGFTVEAKSPKDELSEDEIIKFGYTADDIILILRKK